MQGASAVTLACRSKRTGGADAHRIGGLDPKVVSDSAAGKRPKRRTTARCGRKRYPGLSPYPRAVGSKCKAERARMSAAIAIGARIDRAAFLQRAACRAGAPVAQDPNRGLEFFEKNRPGEIVTLRIADLGGGLQIRELLERFDALCNDGHAEGFAQRFDRPQNALAAWAFMNVGDERSVDLDFVGGDIGQRRQRRIADTE